MYRVDGKLYEVTTTKEPKVGGLAITPENSIFVIDNVETTRSAIGTTVVTVSGTYPKSMRARKAQPTSDYDVSDVKLLSPVVTDPCPWCGGELMTMHEFEDPEYDKNSLLPALGKIMTTYHKQCPTCGSVGKSPYKQTSYVEWWNLDEMMFDPATKEILFNPNFIDED
jgi:ribosomal protein S27AE